MSDRLELLTAYRNTDFIIYVPGGELVMRCEQESHAIDELVKTFGKTTCAFITAQNPGSVKLGVLENAQRHQELLHERIGYPHFPGRGVERASSWDPEESVFIIGIPKSEARKLGHAFGRMAVVVKELGCRAELILCI